MTRELSGRRIVLVVLEVLLVLAGFPTERSWAQTAPADPTHVDANVTVASAPAGFQYGMNFGWTGGWNNQGFADIASRAGATTSRIKLPEWLFDQYGYAIEYGNGDMARYQQDGLTNLTAFLVGPTAAHSNAPGGASTEQYSPVNLYQPIWSSPGVVNPSNYWANYVYNTVSTYKGQVKVWEVWNEPDFTNNWPVTQADWWTSPPKPSDLPNWNDSVFSYIRMLHVTYEAAKAADPTSVVAVGGLGYESFLDAILRYTENPADGSVNAQYPVRGGAYFDAVSFHHYPQYAVYDDSNQTWLRNLDSDAMATGYAVTQNNFRLPFNKWGYNEITYPTKLWLTTETGLSSKAVGTASGGDELQRNYLLKMATIAQVNQIMQVHWYDLFDAESDTASSGEYQHMGLYYDVQGQTPAQAHLKPSAVAYTTYSTLMRGYQFDTSATSALNLPAGVAGYVFTAPNAGRTYVLWAKTANNNETASARLQLPTGVALTLRAWDSAATHATQVLAPINGAVALTLSETPVFLTEGVPSGQATATATTIIPATAMATSRSTATPTAATTASAGPDVVIYDDALRGGWQSQSWGGAFDFAQTGTVYSGSSAIAVTYGIAQGVLVLHNDNLIPTSGRTTLHLTINGGSTGGQRMTLRLADWFGHDGPAVNLAGYLPGGVLTADRWQTVDVPLADLGFHGNGFNRMEITNAAGRSQPTFYLGDLELR